MMLSYAINLLLGVGAFLMLTSAVGLFRFKDAASRLHPPTKASALGLSLILLASALSFAAAKGDLVYLFQAKEILGIVFVVLVSPLVGHLLLRALR